MVRKVTDGQKWHRGRPMAWRLRHACSTSEWPGSDSCLQLPALGGNRVWYGTSHMVEHGTEAPGGRGPGARPSAPLRDGCSARTPGSRGCLCSHPAPSWSSGSHRSAGAEVLAAHVCSRGTGCLLCARVHGCPFQEWDGPRAGSPEHLGMGSVHGRGNQGLEGSHVPQVPPLPGRAPGFLCLPAFGTRPAVQCRRAFVQPVPYARNALSFTLGAPAKFLFLPQNSLQCHLCLLPSGRHPPCTGHAVL